MQRIQQAFAAITKFCDKSRTSSTLIVPKPVYDHNCQSSALPILAPTYLIEPFIIWLYMSIKDYYRSMVDKHPLAAEILRFVLVGIAATLVDYVVSALVLFLFDPGGYPTFLSFLGVGKNAEPSTAASVVSTGVGFIAGLIVNYILSIVFVYINKGKSKTTIGFVIFAALAAGGLAVNLVGMWLIYNVSGLAGSEHSMIWYWAVKIMLTTIVLMYNYITRKTIIFKSSKNIAAETEGASDEK